MGSQTNKRARKRERERAKWEAIANPKMCLCSIISYKPKHLAFCSFCRLFGRANPICSILWSSVFVFVSACPPPSLPQPKWTAGFVWSALENCVCFFAWEESFTLMLLLSRIPCTVCVICTISSVFAIPNSIHSSVH